ncbi:TPA: hypothetical protein DDZ10_05060 [Candidatus Uhrbacteria bacterium]|nr:hypothetical protein [Candidatus Uhrbacteria bacterium]
MKSIIISLIALSLFTGSFGFVSAQTPGQTCECWCGLESRGADMKGNNFINADQCRAKCATVKETFLSCSFEGDRTSPHTNLRCWDTKECHSSGGEPSDKTPAECLPGFAHCFAKDEPVKLIVALGEFGFVQGIGGYINAFYQWILGAAALFAVVMIMVGAIQYMMSGGSSSGVGEAKKRIFGALIGLVILLGAYVILNTVNPQLLSLRLPALPKVKPVWIAQVGQSCESYMDAGYTVANPSDREYTDKSQPCGKKGKITKGSNGETLSGDDKCQFRGCGQGVCRINVEEDTAACHTCLDIYEASSWPDSLTINRHTELAEFKPGPSQTMCQATQSVDVGPGVDITSCVYVSATPPSTRVAATPATCAELRCNQGLSGCENYDNLRPITALQKGIGVPRILRENAQASAWVEVFRSACENNICGYGSTGCKLQPTDSSWTCVNK